jgi:glycosyltransferase involved in cell wall biosynthesis
MRVAFFSDTYLPQVNGVTRTLRRLRTFLTGRGVDNIMLAPFDPRGVEDDTVYTFPSVPLPFYPEMRLGLPWESQVDKTLGEFKPDVVHLVTEYAMGVAGLKWAQKTHTPFVASFHTNIPQYLMYYNLPFLSEAAWHYLVWFHNQCRINFCPSQATRELLAARGMQNLHIWGRGVDSHLFHPFKRCPSLRHTYGVTEDACLLLYVGRIAPEKGLEVLTRAFALVNKEIPSARLVIVGDGPLAPKLKQQAQPNVIFAGELAAKELAVHYASGDVFAFPSTSETYGNVVLEAMASGLPVVAPLAGGVTENLVPSINGMSFTADDAVEMAAVLTELINDRGLRQALGHNARQHAEARTWDSAFAPVVDGYYSVALGLRATAV